LLATTTIACGHDTNAPTTSLTPLEVAIAQRYRDEFGETIPRPALFTPTLDATRPCDWHVTSTAWTKPSGATATLLTLYTSPDGRTTTLKSSGTYLRPAGTFRVLVALVRHPQSVGTEGLALWEAAQRQMNTDHQSFASAKGYATPLVTFTNTNVVFEPDELRGARSRAATVAALAARGYAESAYDVIVSVNIDPATTEGGFSLPGQEFIYMGNFGFSQLPLGASAYGSIARAVYGHEFAHLWGWPGTHDWAACHTGTFPFSFWVPPILLGWEDVDGDGIPEIRDPDPYGGPRR
jgi:hypothetical protein